MLQLPFFGEIARAQRIILAGAGGGFDIFCGLPLYFALQSEGREVYLANLSFSALQQASGIQLAPGLKEITAASESSQAYFPELYLSRWFKERGRNIPIFAFERMGVQILRAAYEALITHLQADAVILIDGGTDSLMRGDEAGLGTPAEDITSIAAVNLLDVPVKLLVALGFGIDAYHGVCHAQVLEATADLIRAGGFLGAWTLMREMPEVQLYREATEAVFSAMPHHPSIVSASILSALDGHFGDHHATQRTRGSELFINPLMSIYWCFQLSAVARRILYLDEMNATHTINDVAAVLRKVHVALEGQRPRIVLPM